jgi:UDP-galactopyranose mutase
MAQMLPSVAANPSVQSIPAVQSILVFSHLRWDFVFQRPQHVLTRLAKHYRVYFFEEPVASASNEHLEINVPVPNVHICRPHSTLGSPGFHDDQIPTLQRMVLELVKRERIEDYAVWFYSPMALPLMKGLEPAAVIYDCMDELAAFRNAPRQLLQRESALLRAADMVFTGGPSLYRAKRERHASVHCLPSSVDAAHFSKARRPVGERQRGELSQPRLGYFGVIDERIDLELIAALADARPQWQIDMIGPHAKIDPQLLPRRPNIHYLGLRPYEELPELMARWEVCLQPFALNEATRYISPTKTLEYMAAEKPIVSTPVTDVVEPYGEFVYIANGAGEFIDACERALHADEAERGERLARMRETLAQTSWDRTAERMRALLEAAVQMRGSSVSVVSFKPPARGDTSRSGEAVALDPPTPEYSAIVIGAGPTGLSAAYHLGGGSLLLEQNETVGGWCRSIADNGFTFDYAGHIMFSNDRYVHELYGKLLGDNLHWQDREAWIYSKNVYTRYPFQGALYGLPADVLKDCIVGAIEARFGPLKQAPAQAPTRKSVPASSSVCIGKAESITDCCADGVAESTVPLGAANEAVHGPGAAPANFEEFIYKVWGAGVAKHFAIPYNRKLWAVPLTEMETSWLGGRVPLPDLEEMIEGALRPVAKPVGPNARFGYPLRGGFQSLVNGFLPLLKGDLRTNAQVAHVLPKERKVVLADGVAYRYRKLVSTAPLPKLIQMIGAQVPQHVLAAAQRLRHVSVRCVNIGVAREHVCDKHWIYYPEDSVFHRIFVQGNASPHCNAPGGFGLTCEITYSASKPLPCEGEALIDRCIEDCIEVGILRSDDVVLARNQVDMPYAYVVYDHARKQNVEIIREWLLEYDILLAGRYSEWEYYNSDHAFIAGKKVADAVLAAVDSTNSVEAVEGA